MPEANTPTTHALLIGVDFYFPHVLPGATSYGSLSGCVSDVERVEEFLLERVGVPEERISMLTSSRGGDGQPDEPEAQWPTHDNMVAALEELTARAGPGDHIYVHYSGHGGRAPTRLPEVKGADALDEGLVPVDIGSDDADYLRDTELAHLFGQMVDKGLLVTIVLDCCHSGGMSRGRGDAAERGIAEIDTTPRTAAQAATPDDLARSWREATDGGARAAKPAGGWLPDVRDYVLLAACRPHESAHERYYDGVRSGALTWWLLDTLADLSVDQSWAMVFGRVQAKVLQDFTDQAPQLQGEMGRAVFGSDVIQSIPAVRIMSVDDGQVTLGAGRAQGIRKGSCFAVYPRLVADLAAVERRLAIVEVDEAGATESSARITTRLADTALAEGDQAVLVNPGTVRLRRRVALCRRDDLPASVDQGTALERAGLAIEEHGMGWVVLTEDASRVDYQVVVDEHGHYEVWDKGGAVIQLRPPLPIVDDGSARQLASRLRHMARFASVKALDNRDVHSPVVRGLGVELRRFPEGYDHSDGFQVTQPVDPSRIPAELRDGDLIELRITNDTPKPINVAILALGSDWGISAVYPHPDDGAYATIDPGATGHAPIQLEVPEGDECLDTLKVFATYGTANFGWLALPPLDQPHRARAGVRSVLDPLDALLLQMSEAHQGSRHAVAVAQPSRAWGVRQVDVRVVKR